MGREGESAVSKLIEGIYDASLDHARWGTVLQGVAEFVGGTGAIIYSHDLAANQVTWASFVGMDPDGIRAYEQYYSKIDARYAPALALPTGAVLTERTIMEERQLRKTEFFQDFLKPYDIPHIAASILHTEPEFVAISVQGTRRHGPFGTAELERLELLVPHLARAVTIGNRIGAHQNKIRLLQGLLDTIAVGVVALDADGRVLEANSVARTAIARQDAFICRGRQLHARSSTADGALRGVISSALCSPRESYHHGPGTAVIPRIDGRRGYSVVACPIARSSPFKSNDQISAFLILIDHDARPPSLKALLIARFSLSPAETSVADLLFCGLSLREIADSRRTSLETTRKQVKSLLYKTGTKSQGQLIRILAELAAVSTTGRHADS